jgi:ATP-dependent Clp protease adaptor protein ClpS
MTQRHSGTEVQERQEVTRPPLYRVVLLNDDYTPMDFVVYVLMRYFRLGGQDAERVMMAVHRQGRGVAGVYTREIAETKVAQVSALAREEGYPLQLVTEPEPSG